MTFLPLSRDNRGVESQKAFPYLTRNPLQNTGFRSATDPAERTTPLALLERTDTREAA